MTPPLKDLKITTIYISEDQDDGPYYPSKAASNNILDSLSEQSEVHYLAAPPTPEKPSTLSSVKVEAFDSLAPQKPFQDLQPLEPAYESVKGPSRSLTWNIRLFKIFRSFVNHFFIILGLIVLFFIWRYYMSMTTANRVATVAERAYKAQNYG